MSTAGAIRTARQASPARTTGPVRTAPRLRVVSTPENLRSRGGLIALCLGLLAVGLVGLLVLTVGLSRGAYDLRRLRAGNLELADQRQALQEEIAAVQAPQNLAAQARTLGMVPAPNVAVVRRSDGAVLGEPKAAAGLPAPVVPHGRHGSQASAQPSTQGKSAPSPGAKPGATPGTAAPADAATTTGSAATKPAPRTTSATKTTATSATETTTKTTGKTTAKTTGKTTAKTTGTATQRTASTPAAGG